MARGFVGKAFVNGAARRRNATTISDERAGFQWGETLPGHGNRCSSPADWRENCFVGFFEIISNDHAATERQFISSSTDQLARIKKTCRYSAIGRGPRPTLVNYHQPSMVRGNSPSALHAEFHASGPLSALNDHYAGKTPYHRPMSQPMITRKQLRATSRL